MEPYQGDWVKAKKEGVSLQYHHLAQIAYANSLDIMMAKAVKTLKSMGRKINLLPQDAIAADMDTPPMPMGAVGESSASSSGGG